MEPFLKNGNISGKIVCPNDKCGVKIGNFDWAGVQCGCKEWVTPVSRACRSRPKLKPRAFVSAEAKWTRCGDPLEGNWPSAPMCDSEAAEKDALEKLSIGYTSGASMKKITVTVLHSICIPNFVD